MLILEASKNHLPQYSLGLLHISADSVTQIKIWFRFLPFYLVNKRVTSIVLHEDNHAFILLTRRKGLLLTSNYIFLRYYCLKEKVLELFMKSKWVYYNAVSFRSLGKK